MADDRTPPAGADADDPQVSYEEASRRHERPDPAAAGGGGDSGFGAEWPSPSNPARGPAPGTDPVHRAQAERDRHGGDAMPADPDATPESARRSSELHTGDESEIEPPEGFKDALERDPDTGGSGSAPR